MAERRSQSASKKARSRRAATEASAGAPSPTPVGPPGEGRFRYDGLNRLMHEKARLGLMTCLIGAPEGLSFGDLKRLCDLTDGNLNRHLKQLEDAGLVSTERIRGGGRPQTLCIITDAGRQQFSAYLSELQRVVADAQGQLRGQQQGRGDQEADGQARGAPAH
ncbi:MAG: transcriptional regulator [Planctomycetota bacterium]